MTQILFQRCDGKPAGAPIALPRGRRRLSTIARAHADRSRPHIVSLHRKKHPLGISDVSVRLRKDWSNITVGPLDTVIIVYLPRGGSGGRAGGGGAGKGASIGLLVATIALAAVGQFWAIGALAPLVGGTAVAGSIWAAGTAVAIAGGGYLLSRATQAKANKSEDSRPVYGVSGGGNQPRSGDRIPVLYGRCWNTPDLSQPDYTVYDGEDQVLYKRLTIGCGKYAIKTIRVSNVVMWTHDGGLTPPFAGNAQIDPIAPGGTSSLVPGQVASVAAVGGNEVARSTGVPAHTGPFDFGSGAPLQSRIQLDYSLPQGCYAVGAGKFEGKQFPVYWGVLFEYAPCDEDGAPVGPWNPLHSDGGTVLSTRAMRFTRFVDIPPGRYAFRASNIAPGEPAVPSLQSVMNQIIWEGLRAHIPQVTVRPGITELALRIRSGKELGVTSYGEVEVETSRILPVWNGSGWTEEETAKSVWAMADILRDPLHGAGLADSAIDLPRLRHYASTLSQFDQFNGVIRGPVSVYEALTTVLGTMRASPLRLGSAWTLVRDEAKSVRKHVISRRQILKDSTGQTFNLDLSDGSADVIVEWFTGGDPKKRRDHRVTFGTLTNVPRRMMATGVNSAEHAIHLATWAAATAYYRRERRSVTMELAGRLLLPNDKAAIDAWYFDATVTAGVWDRDGLELTVDDDNLELPAGAYAILRARDGREWGPVAVSQTAPGVLALDAADVAQAQSLSGLTLDQVISTSTQAYTTVVIGTLSEMQDAWLIRSIQFSGDSNVNVEAVFDAPQVWSALNEAISPPPPPPSSGLETPASIAVPYVRADAVQRNAAMFMDWTCGRARNAATYVVSISYDGWATSEEAYRGQASSGSYPLRETAGIVYVRAFAISTSGLVSLPVSTQFAIAPAVIDLSRAIHGSLAIEAFTDGIEPVTLVDGLPDPVGYTGTKLVFDINDEKQYRYTVDGWKPVFDVSDIPNGSITEVMIGDDTISTPKLRANSISTDKIIAGAITASKLAADSVTAGKIQAGAVSADKINVTKLDAISAVLGNVIVDGNLVVNGTLTNAKIGSGQVGFGGTFAGGVVALPNSDVDVNWYDAHTTSLTPKKDGRALFLFDYRGSAGSRWTPGTRTLQFRILRRKGVDTVVYGPVQFSGLGFNWFRWFFDQPGAGYVEYVVQHSFVSQTGSAGGVTPVSQTDFFRLDWQGVDT